MPINLLPEQEKIYLKNEDILKKISIILLFVLIAVFFLIFIFFFLKLFFLAKIESSQKQIFQIEKELKSDLFQNFQKTIEEKNQDLFQIQTFRKKQIFIAPIFEKIFSLITPGSIYFTDFSFQKNFNGQIHFSGWVRNRQELFYFKKDIESKKDFKEVYFSPDSWVKPTDIDFSLNFQTNEF